jgi:hypothetical protein
MTTRFENKTGKGNVVAMRIEVKETPHSHAGIAHAQLICELTNGSESTRAGQYFLSLADAEKQADEWAAMAVKSGLAAA